MNEKITSAEEAQECRDFIADLDLFVSAINGTKEQMKSEPGKELVAEFESGYLSQMRPYVLSMKGMLAEWDEKNKG